MIAKTMVTLWGVPFDEYSSFLRGAARAPQKIREAFHCPSSNHATENGIDLEKEIRFFDGGDINIGGSAVDDIEKKAKEFLHKGMKLLTLGGDHSIAYPLIKAYSQYYSPITVLHLDAHSDIYDNFEGNRYSHACPFARVMEEGLAERLVQIGIRTLTTHQREQIKRFGVETFEMKDWKGVLPNIKGDVYISLDLDVLDPAFAPGVSHHEPGGLSTRDVIGIIQNVGGNIIGADLVEYNPDRDLNGVTGMVAAKLMKELAARLLCEC